MESLIFVDSNIWMARQKEPEHIVSQPGSVRCVP